MKTPWRRLVQEAARNLAAGRMSTALVILSAATCVWGSAFLEGRSAESARDAFEDFNAAGGHLHMISAPSVTGRPKPPPLSRHNCERLSLLQGVAGAGSLGDATAVKVLAAPGERLELVPVTPGVLDVIASYEAGSAHTAGDLIIEPEMRSLVGSATGLALAGHGIRPVKTARLQTLGPGYARSAFGSVAPTGAAERCVVALEPRAQELSNTLLAAFGRTDLVIRRVLAGTDLVPSALAQHDSRDSRHVWWISTVLAALVFRFLLWTRRSDIAVYRLFGVGKTDTSLILTAELLMGTAVGGLIGAGAARVCLAAAGSHTESIVLGWYGAALAVSGLVLACCVVPLTLGRGRRDPMDALKNR